MYLDGALINSIASGNTSNMTYPVYIGKGYGDRSLNGIIDEVRVYNRALSASEIQELYNQGTRKAQFRKY